MYRLSKKRRQDYESKPFHPTSYRRVRSRAAGLKNEEEATTQTENEEAEPKENVIQNPMENGSNSFDLNEGDETIVPVPIDEENAVTEKEPQEKSDLTDEPNQGELNNDDVTNSESRVKIDESTLHAFIFGHGSKRMHNQMYEAVRECCLNRRCKSCGVVVGPKLPGLTFLKKLKNVFQEQWYVKTEIAEITVDMEKSGAKCGVDKYSSTSKAPIKIVNISEWARMDFYSPSIRNEIWGFAEPTEAESGICFDDIEKTPIIRRRLELISPFRMKNTCGIDAPITGGSKLTVYVNRTENIKSFLKRLDFCINEENILKNDVSCYRFFVSVNSVDYKTSSKTGFDKIVDREGDIVLYLPSYENTNMEKCFRQMADVTEARWIFRAHVPNKKRTKSMKTMRIIHAETDLSDPIHDESSYSASKGTLSDGRKYLVYRFLMYSDGFLGFRGKSGTMNGIYILLLGISPEKRTENSCIRKIALTPPGVSAGDVFKIIVDDMLKGMVEGIVVHLANEEFVIFLDPVAFTVDGPEAAVLTGTMGSSADMPCHLCCFRRAKNQNFVGSRYGYDANLESSDPVLRRTADRSIDIVEKGAKCCKEIGIKKIYSSLSKMAQKIKSVSNSIPLNSNQVKVVPGCFDTYQNVLISPDHVLYGNSENILEACIVSMRPNDRLKFEKTIISMLNRNGLSAGNRILSSCNRKVATKSISDIYSIMFVSTSALDIVVEPQKKHKKDKRYINDLERIKELLNKLQNIIRIIQWNPSKDIDSELDINEYNMKNGYWRLERLQRYVKEYCKLVHELCKSNSSVWIILDKPNLHRLVELSVHTMPRIGNVKYGEELILEKSHQSMKRGIEHSNNKNAQLQAMNDYLIDTFLCRLKELVETYLKECDKKDEIIECSKQLFRIGQENESAMITDEIMSPKVLEVLNNLCVTMCPSNSKPKFKCKETNFEYTEQERRRLNAASEIVKKYYDDSVESLQLEASEVSVRVIACSELRKQRNRRNRTEKIFSLVPFDFVELVCDKVEPEHDDDFSIVEYEPDGNRRFFCCLGFLKVEITGKESGEKEIETIYGLCKEMKDIGKNLYETEKGGFSYIVSMDYKVQKLFSYHACWTTEEPCRAIGDQFIHASNFNEQKFILKGRIDGFPPRRG